MSTHFETIKNAQAELNAEVDAAEAGIIAARQAVKDAIAKRDALLAALAPLNKALGIKVRKASHEVRGPRGPNKPKADRVTPAPAATE